MVQARILLAAIALTVTVPSAQAMPSCAEIREIARHYTPKQIRALMKRARLSREQEAAVRQCLGGR